MNEAQQRAPFISSAQHDIVMDWLGERQTVIENKVKGLEAHVQQKSREAVIQKYGKGPHKVKFTVQFIDSKEEGSFVMEMASIDLMPHSVHFFLDQISLGLWDNTVFWHHDGVDHVISAAAVAYQTGEPKHHHFQALDVGPLSFAEYANSLPHKPWTVGFAGAGPEFYINTVDNTILHGPGGQGQHHHLPGQADPCFATITDGVDVVSKMYNLSQKQSNQAERRRDWHDNELTRIVKAEVLK